MLELLSSTALAAWTARPNLALSRCSLPACSSKRLGRGVGALPDVLTIEVPHEVSQRFYPDRASRGDCNYRDSDRLARAGRPKGSRVGGAYAVCQQSQANRLGHAQLRIDPQGVSSR